MFIYLSECIVHTELPIKNGIDCQLLFLTPIIVAIFNVFGLDAHNGYYYIL